MKRVVVVTGAASGMGKYFAVTVKNNIDIDEIWAVDRNEDGLKELEQEVKLPVKPLIYDLTKEESFIAYRNLLEEEKPNIVLLINAAGYGIFDSVKNTTYENNSGMIELNCLGLVKMTTLSIPYLKKGSKIINFSSMAAFEPIPYINIYAATKAFVLSFSRALNRELKRDGVSVMAVTPFWTKTKFFDRAVTQNKVVKKYVVMYEPSDVINKAWKDLKKGKDYSAYGFITNFQIFLTKIMPHKFIMWYWMKQQNLK